MPKCDFNKVAFILNCCKVPEYYSHHCSETHSKIEDGAFCTKSLYF